MKLLVLLISLVSSLAFSAELQNRMDELDPFSPNIQNELKSMDYDYEFQTGLSSHILDFSQAWTSSCTQIQCEVYAQIVKSQQKLYLYEHGNLTATWDTSTGIPGRETPLLNTHPDGRIYNSYTSTKFPGGDYLGLGNMPYAVFIQGGFAIHGTGKANWPKLGSKASHGCIRIHPDNAKYFNGLVRKNGVQSVWVSVQE